MNLFIATTILYADFGTINDGRNKAGYMAIRCVLVLIVVLVKNGTFALFQLVCDGQTNGRTDGRMDGRTDRPSYRDARTHLKRIKNQVSKKAQRP